MSPRHHTLCGRLPIAAAAAASAMRRALRGGAIVDDGPQLARQGGVVLHCDGDLRQHRRVAAGQVLAGSASGVGGGGAARVAAAHTGCRGHQLAGGGVAAGARAAVEDGVGRVEQRARLRTAALAGLAGRVGARSRQLRLQVLDVLLRCGEEGRGAKRMEGRR